MPDLAHERIQQLLERYVGFEHFSHKKLEHRLPPGTTYVALHGRYVLLCFSEQKEADEFFAAAIETTLGN